VVPAGLAFAAFGALRFFKAMRVELTERGLEGMSPRKRGWCRWARCRRAAHRVAHSTCTQAVGGFYSAPYPPAAEY